jgi:hypothetical protein
MKNRALTIALLYGALVSSHLYAAPEPSGLCPQKSSLLFNQEETLPTPTNPPEEAEPDCD